MSIIKTKLLAGVMLISLIFCANLECTAQNRTGATDKETKINKKKQAPKKRRPLYIVRKDTQNILYGNRCFLDVQRAMGFEYLVQPKGQPLNRSGFSRNLHNLGVKFVLLFKNGPFWQIRLSKRKKECQKLSGDFVG
jgi:hypothetical protein